MVAYKLGPLNMVLLIWSLCLSNSVNPIVLIYILFWPLRRNRAVPADGSQIVSSKGRFHQLYHEPLIICRRRFLKTVWSSSAFQFGKADTHRYHPWDPGCCMCIRSNFLHYLVQDQHLEIHKLPLHIGTEQDFFSFQGTDKGKIPSTVLLKDNVTGI